MNDLVLRMNGEPPPSENAIKIIRWSHNKGHRQASIGYSAEAQAWLRWARDYLREHYLVDLTRFAKAHRPEDVYYCAVTVSFPLEKLVNSGWVKNKAKNPYKVVDGPNRNKLLLDAVSQSLGLDDSLFFGTSVHKEVSDDDEFHVTVELSRVEPTAFGVPESSLRGQWTKI
jgi:hypothetical protein